MYSSNRLDSRDGNEERSQVPTQGSDCGIAFPEDCFQQIGLSGRQSLQDTSNHHIASLPEFTLLDAGKAPGTRSQAFGWVLPVGDEASPLVTRKK